MGIPPGADKHNGSEGENVTSVTCQERKIQSHCGKQTLNSKGYLEPRVSKTLEL